MANSKQADKRARQNVKRRSQNVVKRTRFRTYQKKVVNAINANDKNLATESFKEFISVADKTTSDGIIHRNKSARIKKRLHAQVKNLSLENQD